MHSKFLTNLARKISWFQVAIICLFLFALVLRFWGLSRFNTLVFDENIYVEQSNNYLTKTAFFSDHPPLSKYLIALGIWLDTHNPFGQYSPPYPIAASQLNAFSYRWMNAFFGSFVPLIVSGIAYQLSHRRSYALLAGGLAAIDGFLLVDSRYALNNIYIVTFGLLGQWLLLLALASRVKRRRLYLALSGIFFGACLSIKWNGLGFLLGAYCMWGGIWLLQKIQSLDLLNIPISIKNSIQNIGVEKSDKEFSSPLKNLSQLSWIDLLCDLGLIPAIIYFVSWAPHLHLFPNPGFWAIHQQSFAFHDQLGSSQDIHPYCSRWYTWPLMLRPVAYFFDQVTKEETNQTIYYAVQGTGNPVLWWFSSAAILIVCLLLIKQIFSWSNATDSASKSPNSAIAFLALATVKRIRNWLKNVWPNRSTQMAFSSPVHQFWIPFYLVSNYSANFLPWAKVSRCTFLYHYMSASIFAFLGLAWLVDRWLSSHELWQRLMGVTILFLVLAAFVFWLPIYLGLPLSPEAFQVRMWLKSWI